MTGQGYFQILMNHLIPFASNVIGPNAILVQDNASSHTYFNCLNLLRSVGLHWIS
jgi:hypothetical protein